MIDSCTLSVFDLTCRDWPVRLENSTLVLVIVHHHGRNHQQAIRSLSKYNFGSFKLLYLILTAISALNNTSASLNLQRSSFLKFFY